VPGAEKEMLGIETLTHVPIERRLIDVAMLSDRELDWLNDYHAAVLDKIGPQLSGEDKAWLEWHCAPLSR
jgi:Xaa-Pro aminopeptidase